MDRRTSLSAGLAAVVLAAVMLAGCGGSQQPAAGPTTPGPTTAGPLPLPRPQPPEGPVFPQAGLGPGDRARLADARRIGAQWVTLVVAAEPARAGEVSAALRELGGVLGTTGAGPSYLRLTMPTGQVERAAAVPGITAIDVEQIISPHHARPSS